MRIEVQVLFEDIPVGLAGVDCTGTEATLEDCQSNGDAQIFGVCGATSTTLGCSNTTPGAAPVLGERPDLRRVDNTFTV